MPSKKSKSKKQMMHKIKSIVCEFAKELDTSFPEYHAQFEPFLVLENINITELFSYVSEHYPPHFFNILYQNEVMLTETTGALYFLPNLDFKLLFSHPTITETTQHAIWKYLQLIIMTLSSHIQDKTLFKDAESLFDGIDEAELKQQIETIMKEMNQFFVPPEESSSSSAPNNSESSSSSLPMPNISQLFENLKGLFDGKIGKLAKEITEEFQDEIKEMFGDLEAESMASMKPDKIFKKLMQDPQKMMKLVQKATSKIKEKFRTGEYSESEMAQEAKEFMKQCKDMGGPNSQAFKEMFQNLSKNMGFGKNAKMDVNAMTRMQKQMSTRERMRANVEKKKAATSAKPPKASSTASVNLTEAQLNELIQKYNLE
jgi:hypothetical protein